MEILDWLVSFIQLVLQTLPLSILHPVFWVFLYLTYSQYKRSIRMEQKLLGRSKNSPKKMTIISLGVGLIAGAFASFILVLLGVNLDQIGIVYIFPLLLFLLLFHPRYLCFAYAGGVVSVVSLVISNIANYEPNVLEVGFLKGLTEINIPSLIALIAVLHLTESVMIYISGHIGPGPVYVKHPDGNVVGAFSLQKFWPLPFVGLIGPTSIEQTENLFSMPDWWPIFSGEIGAVMAVDSELTYALIPLVAILGYGDMSIASNPREKSKQSAVNLALYSIVLLLLSLGAVFYEPILWPAALFAPFGHEALIILGNSSEFSKEPLYKQEGRGVKVLDIMPKSLGEKMGLQSGDVILTVNNVSVSTKEELMTNLYLSQPYVRLNIETVSGEQKFVKAPLYEHQTHLGIVLAPEGNVRDTGYVTLKSNNPIEKFVKKLLGKK
ncbi:PDZ domain-containing protein [Natranaerobius trueperi]|uniref:PDZ domain-containing protein n=1 Tax=Natranaerobius trueperi TaxID=759412 RepID=A0A226BXQ3_9FIRM|nr:PDZ domain-containing protein [Natranaerobius trueperi]OWZ83715.1 hypothetical protein CDO51_07110 [Natranaerobius trueperi]